MKVQITGSVAGIDACRMITDRDEIVVGSALACDLCVSDPLLPKKAFRIFHEQERSDRDEWIVEAMAGTRLYLNRQLVRRDRLEYGDTIYAGCHSFNFMEAGLDSRNFRSNTHVGDLCAELLHAIEIPLGFLRNSPTWLNRQRIKKAGLWGLGIAVVMMGVLLLVPHQRVFESNQPTLEVQIRSERTLSPSPQAVRALRDVKRTTIADQSPARIIPRELMPSPETLENMSRVTPPPLPEMTVPTEVSAKVAPPIPDLVEAELPEIQEQKPEMAKKTSALTPSASSSRQVVKMVEARQTMAPDPIANVSSPDISKRINAAKVSRMTNELTSAVARPVVTGATLDATRLAAMMNTQPSPVDYESYAGTKIPVAHMPSTLGTLEVPGNDSAIVFDGTVSESEIAISWKSGQFRLHARGTPPPYAEPPTYCYVGKTDLNGEPHLYVSFICMDPDVRKIRANFNGQWGNPPRIIDDDEVEVFLDTNFDRNDYHHLIVNAKGQFWAAYVPSSSVKDTNDPRPWSVQPKIKTVINPEAKRWTCEIFIPFRQLGGVPPKGSRWAVNFCRSFRGQYVPESVYQNWFLVYKDETFYHKPSLFGVFQW